MRPGFSAEIQTEIFWITNIMLPLAQPRVLLVRPPAFYHSGSILPGLNIPVGILYIAAVLEREGVTVEILDAQVSLDSPITDLGDGLSRMGCSWEEIRGRIDTFKPDLVGITSSFSAQFESTMASARLVKENNPACRVVVGGNHPTVRPADFLFPGSPVDFACLGEGEYMILDLARALGSPDDVLKVKGMAFCDMSDRLIKSQPREFIVNLDELPYPAYHLVDLESYFRLTATGFKDRISCDYPGSERVVSVITSRGCPFDCIFCSIHLHMGRCWRHNSVKYVREHLSQLISRYGVRHIHFEDDNLSANRIRFSGILTALEEFAGRVTWDTPNGIRVDTLTREIVRKCRDSGCIYLTFGVESGNRRVLNTIINKKLNLDDVEKAAGWCAEYKLDAMAFFVIGFPGETPAEMQDTVEYALRLQRNHNVTPHLFVATPLPGTRLEKICLERGILKAPLSPDQCSTVTQGGDTLDGDTYTAADVQDHMDRFKKMTLCQYIKGAVLFTLQHPALLLSVFQVVKNRNPNLSIVKALFRSYQFKNLLFRKWEQF